MHTRYYVKYRDKMLNGDINVNSRLFVVPHAWHSVEMSHSPFIPCGHIRKRKAAVTDKVVSRK